MQPFAGGGYRLGAAPEEESAYVSGERRQNSAQDVSISPFVSRKINRGTIAVLSYKVPVFPNDELKDAQKRLMAMEGT